MKSIGFNFAEESTSPKVLILFFFLLSSDENQTPPKDVEDGDKQSITIEGLEPDTEYKFVLVLVNGAGPTEIHSTASTEEAAGKAKAVLRLQ